MKIEHIAIWSKDIKRLKSFYETYFDARSNDGYINQAKGFSSYFLTFESGARLELMQNNSIPDSANDSHEQFTGYIHMAFSTGAETAVDELTSRLKKDGFELLDGPRRTGDGYYESVVLDPDGNRIEITV